MAINNKKNDFSLLLVACLLASFTSMSFAQQNVKNEYGLFLSPNLCLLSKAEETCHITIHIRWQTLQSAEYCLHKSPTQPALKCWQSSDRGDHRVEFTLEENLTLYLLNQQDDAIVYRQTVRLQKEAQAYRRSRRNPWRFY